MTTQTWSISKAAKWTDYIKNHMQTKQTKRTTYTATPYSLSGITGDNHLMAKHGYGRRTVAIFTSCVGLNPDEFEATKQFVQTACNCHDDLVGALESCLKCLTMDSDSEEDYAPEIKKARNALARARGDS